MWVLSEGSRASCEFCWDSRKHGECHTAQKCTEGEHNAVSSRRSGQLHKHWENKHVAAWQGPFLTRNCHGAHPKQQRLSMAAMPVQHSEQPASCSHSALRMNGTRMRTSLDESALNGVSRKVHMCVCVTAIVTDPAASNMMHWQNAHFVPSGSHPKPPSTRVSSSAPGCHKAGSESMPQQQRRWRWQMPHACGSGHAGQPAVAF